MTKHINDLENEKFEEYSDYAVRIIPTEHARVHEGTAFMCGHYDAALAAGASMYLSIDPASAIHTVFSIAGGAELTFQFFRNPTFTPGTVLPIFNKNDLSPKVSTANITQGATGVSGGDASPIAYIPGGSGGNAQGGASDFSREWILNPANTYVVKITNVSAQPTEVSCFIDWYEPGAVAP